jgi:hypothetical protein
MGVRAFAFFGFAFCHITRSGEQQGSKITRFIESEE